ncbi:acyl-CoA dehydrogenase family protein [Hansschlegelia plantiphila]|nr:acyl-CoA dehydrogenase family protein [Hansschlegelia plantiphila]
MTEAAGVWGASPSARYEALAAPFRPIFARIRDGAVQREIERTLPYEPIRWLKEARFGALRVPAEHGGPGATWQETTALLIELAEADSNLPQALRGHFGFVDNVLYQPDSAWRRAWIQRFLDGATVGNAFTERSEAKAGTFAARVTPNGSGWVLNGEKFYSTGSLLADYLDVVAVRGEDEFVTAIVPADAAGVSQFDDWDGFGQKLTASGTSRFADVHLEPDAVQPADLRFKYQTAYYQLSHLITLTGIGRAAANDVAKLVRERNRTYSHANGRISREDPQVLQVVGQVHSLAYAAVAVALKVADAVQRVYEAAAAGDAEAEARLNIEAEIESSQGQIVIAKLVLEATTILFNALGASSLAQGKALDRYWRNARTVATHNPLIYKERVVGDYAVNRTEPPFLWLPGAA